MKSQAKGEEQESTHSRSQLTEQTIACPNCRYHFKAAIGSYKAERPK